MKTNATATGSRHEKQLLPLAVEVAVEVAVAFQCDSRKESGSRKANDRSKIL